MSRERARERSCLFTHTTTLTAHSAHGGAKLLAPRQSQGGAGLVKRASAFALQPAGLVKRASAFALQGCKQGACAARPARPAGAFAGGGQPVRGRPRRSRPRMKPTHVTHPPRPRVAPGRGQRLGSNTSHNREMSRGCFTLNRGSRSESTLLCLASDPPCGHTRPSSSPCPASEAGRAVFYSAALRWC